MDQRGRRIDRIRCRNGADEESADGLLTFRFDGEEVQAYEGESIAAALIAAGVFAMRRSRLAMPRGYFCGMGVCWECMVTVNGEPNQRACMQTVSPGMEIETALAVKNS